MYVYNIHTQCSTCMHCYMYGFRMHYFSCTFMFVSAYTQLISCFGAWSIAVYILDLYCCMYYQGCIESQRDEWACFSSAIHTCILCHLMHFCNMNYKLIMRASQSAHGFLPRTLLVLTCPCMFLSQTAWTIWWVFDVFKVHYKTLGVHCRVSC